MSSITDEYCFRCNERLVLTEEHEEITFYYCEPCKRAYAKKLGKSLTDRWLSPISIVLYGLIFETGKIPDEVIERILKRIEHLTTEQLKLIADDIEDELQTPKQRLVDMLDLHGTEEDTRDFLQRFVQRLKSEL